MFVMENVSMLKSDVHRFYCTAEDEKMIQRLQIPCRDDILELSKSFQGLEILLESVKKSFQEYEDYLWGAKFFRAVNILFKRINSKDKFSKSFEKYKKQLRKYAKSEERCVPADEIGKVYEELYVALLKDYENPGGSAELIEAIKISASLQRMYVKYAELKNNNIELGDFMWDKGVCVRVRSYRTQSTIYLKLKYGEPSGTVVNVRKSMWVHPAISRALSVREAARLQTFPDRQ